DRPRAAIMAIMSTSFIEHLQSQLAELDGAGLYKHERVIDSPQSAEIHVEGGGTVLNFCANNYLGLAHHPAIEAAAREGLHRHGSMVMVDDSHAVGVRGAKGRGTPEHCGVMGRVDIITGTLGKALGGASGGYTAGSKEVVAWLRNRSRPYLFSNSLMPVIAHASLRVLDMLERDDSLRRKVGENARYFRERMTKLG